MSKILEIIDLKRNFVMGEETVHALKGVSFSVDEGEFVTIMGSSGSGKSTMLNILGCLDKPSEGDYILDGVNIKELSRDELAKLRNRKIGFVFQAYNLLPRTTAKENVELPLLYNPEVSAEERNQRAIEALTAVKLESRIEHLPNQMSGGQQQRVAIARALVNEPVMILADEATGNLDTRTSYEIMALMQELNKNGKTIVFVTHEPDIASFSSRTITLRDGKVVKDTKNPEVRSAKEALENLPVNDDYK
ncbi:ABC transporter ATP-binding protein [Elizabethkingia miricola]|uniref:ABC transport system ATP-binding protein n=1 Tax=Elizabethkingia miricola TaxID=172045 RepID=A0ABD5B2Y2_ELIMR|nr:ABC transporter ATP-binding protein [Elizabethkingia miricola]MDQ8747766.1 ABC transporter ATP-binding protein [Elizabethkingia miricola]OBS14772.1 ABC transporter ATP-binding protein [Elizabethkingia miricola]OPB89613.1 ABC transporter ATP-binding protein [Elizabethkingia miricola]PSL87285.1 ABC transporter ATP-binding protein [Elizabethkingia miricola]QHQ87938.1 ABC transporter ATP-binding protein [Elizabethkingia miricola]